MFQYLFMDAYEAMEKAESDNSNIRAFLEDFQRYEGKFGFLLSEYKGDTHQTSEDNQADHFRRAPAIDCQCHYIIALNLDSRKDSTSKFKTKK